MEPWKVESDHVSMARMSRAPNSFSLQHLMRLAESEVLNLVSTAPFKEQLDLLVRMERQLAYEWSTNDDDVAEDAIIVGIGGTSTSMLAAGLAYVEPRADIYWTAQVTSLGVFDAGGYAGWAVPEALDRAHELRIMMGVDRVVVAIEERGMWQEAWGRLAEREGYS